MKRIKLDTAARAVKEFVRGLPVDANGVELELEGHVLCKIIPPSQLSEAQREAVVKKGWQLIEQARERNKGVPAATIAREVRQAVKEVRRRRK